MPPDRGLSCACAAGAAAATISASPARMGKVFEIVIDRAPFRWYSAEPAAQARVGDIADRVAKEVQPEHRQADRHSRKEYHPRRGLDGLDSCREHAAPRGLVGRRPRPDEAERS